MQHLFPHVLRPTRLLLVAVLLVLGGFATAGPAAAGGSDPAAFGSATSGWVRAGHLSPGTPRADVRLTPFSGGKVQVIKGVQYGDVTPFRRVPQGLYTVALVAAGSAMTAPAMVSKTVRVQAGTARTVIATGRKGAVTASVLTDDLTPPPAGEARVRLVSAAASAPEVSARVVGGPLLARDVRAGGSTGYATVPAQTWSVAVTGMGGTNAKVTGRVPVDAGSVYTLLVLDDPQGGLSLQAVKDSTGSTSQATGKAPMGGVDTGAGGLAPHAAGTGDAVTVGPLGVAAGLLLAGAGLFLVALRRARSGSSLW